MIPSAFEYVRASSLDDALGRLGDGSKVLAGGQSILPLMKLRLARPPRLVDIGRLAELRGLRRLPDSRVAVGALTTYADLMESPLMQHDVLADALPTIGDVQVRNRGTIGGAIAHADPASDLPACLLALDAEVVTRSRAGERVIPIGEFLTGAFTTALRDDEILTEVRLRMPEPRTGSAYVSLEQKASGYAIVGVAAVVRAGITPGIGEARVGITGVGDVAYRATGVEAAIGAGDGIEAAAARATEGQTVNGDIHADAEYRAAMAAVYTRRALEAALARIA
jgi:aerobic carbon-monoxide dehydrogenase medium subunit